MTPKKSFCPGCEKKTKVIRISELHLKNMNGTKIYWMHHFWMCTKCNERWTTADPKSDSLPLLYEEFKLRTGKQWRGIAGKQKYSDTLVATFGLKEGNCRP